MQHGYHYPYQSGQASAVSSICFWMPPSATRVEADFSFLLLVCPLEMMSVIVCVHLYNKIPKPCYFIKKEDSLSSQFWGKQHGVAMVSDEWHHSRIMGRWGSHNKTKSQQSPCYCSWRQYTLCPCLCWCWEGSLQSSMSIIEHHTLRFSTCGVMDTINNWLLFCGLKEQYERCTLMKERYLLAYVSRRDTDYPGRKGMQAGAGAWTGSNCILSSYSK